MPPREQGSRRDNPYLSPVPLPIPGDVGLRRTLAAGSTARLATTLLAVACMAGTGVATARVLGPDRKGIVSSLSYLAAIGAAVATLGLGDAAVVMKGRRRMRFAAATSVAIVGSLGAGAVVMVLVAGIGAAMADSLWIGLLGALAVPVMALMQTLMRVLEGRDRIGFAGFCYLLFAAVTLGSTLVALVLFDMGVEGALLASAVGSLVACIVLARDRHIPRSDRADARVTRQELLGMVRIGLPMMAANALRLLARRLDGLLVFGLRGAAQAGLYSVALTMSEIALYAPGAVATAAFPKLAELDEGEDAGGLVAELTRVTIVVTALAALALAVASPALLPAAFGDEFSGTVVPAVLLLTGAPAMSTQWLLARALAARGRPETLFWSGAVTTVSMLALDLVLVPPFGAAGAAAASGVASVIGCAMTVVGVRRHAPGVPLRSYVPGPSDLRRVVRLTSTLRASRKP